jgi:hypothetical protein
MKPMDPEAARADLRGRLEALAATRDAQEASESTTPPRFADVDPSPASDTKGEQNPSQATRLVDLALRAGIELWHTPVEDAYATIPAAGHLEHHRLDSVNFRDWLSRLLHSKVGRTPGTQAIKDAINTLGGMARYDGAEHSVYVRVGGAADAVYLDLGDKDWRAVKITASGWEVINDPEIRFRRGRAALPLPEPLSDGSVDALRDVIHVAHDDDWKLIVAWLLGALRPVGPYPLLALDGEQGAGKSTAARMIRGVIDPSATDLRAEPREIRDLMAAASGGWVMTFDNLSHLPNWLSDALCRISTGGALSTRRLYTDDDEHFTEAIRPVIVTGIASVVTRGDLQDRTIAITLPAIPQGAACPEAELRVLYDRHRAQTLGALLDGIVCALRRRDHVRPASLPRLADFGLWATAAEPALGYDEGVILRVYAASKQQAVEEALEGDPLAVAIRRLRLPWEGTADNLLQHSRFRCIDPVVGRKRRAECLVRSRDWLRRCAASELK